MTSEIYGTGTASRSAQFSTSEDVYYPDLSPGDFKTFSMHNFL